MGQIDLQPACLRQLLDILAAHVPDAEVWAYGSRVTGSAHQGSDLDLIVRNPGQPGAPQPNLRQVREALSESDLPMLVEVLDWALIPEPFRVEIERRHVVLQCPRQPAARSS